MIARVVTELSLDRGFDYLIPEELATKLRVGSAVTVPFGRSLREGVVLALLESSPYPLSKLKPIAGLCSARADIPEKLIELGQWIAEYYCCSQEHAIRTLLPAAVRSGKIRPKTRKLFTIVKGAESEKIILESAEKSSLRSRALILRELRSAGTMSLDSLKKIPNFSMSSLNTLLKNEIIAEEEEIVRADIFGDAVILPSKPLPPTPDQKKALALFDDMMQGRTSSKVMLLHGVTNSGKTEVYLQCIAKVLDAGKSAIVLVPEISLTPQTLRRFRARFGDALSVLHSRLSERERYNEWNRINEGKVRIAIGARSALFAPFRNLGLIVVDEEHESTYKQSESPRYMARDVAVMRGKFEDACVILGSATPSAESMFNANNGKFLLAKMNSQANDNAAPVMRLVDLRLENPEDGNPLFSKPLIEAVRDRIARGEQSILFLNLRGYARVMVCKECSYEAWCPECSVHYTYSKS
ncbi:MAG: primosomal protein N', partial [Lentisphaeria bacterium]|nr:primosomal protein N' [Lentisphaeria bacterium]